MKKLCLTLFAILCACGSDDDGSDPPTLSTSAAIQTFLDGKTWKMSGANLPSHPNGFSEDINFGASSQCYQDVTMSFAAGNVTVTSALATITGTTMAGQSGTCDHTQAGAPLMFTSNSILIENIQGNATCFDFTATYTGFSQEGRGKISADGTTLTLELYFAGQATGHRCAAGAVGASTVTLNGAAFTGNAQQVYVVQ